jgi:hypothetical protein
MSMATDFEVTLAGAAANIVWAYRVYRATLR